MKRSYSCLRQHLLSRTASLMFVAVTALVMPPPAQAQTTLVVDDDGQGTAADCNAGASAFNSIQAAVNAAAPGDTILICPGTYDEQVAVTTSDLTIRGAGASLTILRPSAVNPIGTDLNFGVPMRPILLVDHAAGVTVSDLKIDGGIADGGSGIATCNFPAIGAYVGIYYRNSSGTVQSTHVTNMRSATICTRGFSGESDLAGASNMVLNGNLFDNYGEVGIACIRANTNCTLTGNTVRGRGRVNDEVQSGIQVRFAAATISGNVITDHYFLPRHLPQPTPFGGIGAIANGIFLAAVDPTTHPHILQLNIFANNELNVQRVD